MTAKITGSAVKAYNIQVAGKEGVVNLGLFTVTSEWKGFLELSRVTDGATLIAFQTSEPHFLDNIFPLILERDEPAEFNVIKASPDIVTAIVSESEATNSASPEPAEVISPDPLIHSSGSA